jgi:hypothetical protein
MGGKPVKLWGALHFLEPERSRPSGAGSMSGWRSEDNGYGKQVHGIQDRREDAFWEHLKPYMIRRTKAEVLKELPPKQYVERWCEMTPQAAKQYEAMATDAELKIEEENLTATGILAEYMRLKQFAVAHQKVKPHGRRQLKVSPPTSRQAARASWSLLEERGITVTGRRRQTRVTSRWSSSASSPAWWSHDHGST